MKFSEQLRIVRHERCAPEYYRIRVLSSRMAEEASPGQFFMVRMPGGGTDPFLRRPLGLHRVIKDMHGAPTGFELFYKVVGRGTEILSSLRDGDSIGVVGPLGRGFHVSEKAARHLIVAGGCGVAPMVALAEALAETGAPVRVLYGGATAEDVPCADDFVAPSVGLTVSTEDGSTGVEGIVTEGLTTLLADDDGGHDAVVYACGPNAMLAAVIELAEGQGVPCQVSLEALMGCGVGACMSCVVRAREDGPEPKYMRVCAEGPVFDSREIAWDDLRGGTCA